MAPSLEVTSIPVLETKTSKDTITPIEKSTITTAATEEITDSPPSIPLASPLQAKADGVALPSQTTVFPKPRLIFELEDHPVDIFHPLRVSSGSTLFAGP